MTPEELKKLNNQTFTGNPNANYNFGNPIPLSTLTSNETPMKLPPQTPELNYAGITDTVVKMLNPETADPAEQQQDDFQTQILDLTKTLGEKEQYQAEQDKAFGVTEFNNQLRDVNSQINALNLEKASIPLQLQENAKGRGITEGGLAPIENGLLRQNAIKSLTLSAKGQLLVGNIQNARDLADRSVAIKFAPIENKLKFLQAAYAMNKDKLERKDKKRADQLGFLLQEHQRLIDNQKEDMKVGQGLAMTALKNNPGNKQAEMAANEVMKLDPTDPLYLQKVFELIGPYQSDPIAMQKALDEHLQARAQIAKMEADIKAIEADTSLTPEKKRLLIAQIEAQRANARQSDASADASKANADKIRAETNAITNPPTPGGTPEAKAQHVQFLLNTTADAKKTCRSCRKKRGASVGRKMDSRNYAIYPARSSH